MSQLMSELSGRLVTATTVALMTVGTHSVATAQCGGGYFGGWGGYPRMYAPIRTVAHVDVAPVNLWGGGFGAAGGLTYLDTAASYLYWQTNDASWDMYHNCIGAPGYRATYREMYKLLQTVKVISAAVRDEEIGTVGPAFPIAITQDLLDAHAMLQGLKIDVDQWQAAANQPGNPGPLSLSDKLDHMDRTLCGIMETVGIPLPHAAATLAPPTDPPAAEPPIQPETPPQPTAPIVQ